MSQDAVAADESAVYWINESEKERLLVNEYKLGDIIGRGTSSTVHRCLHKGRTEWACKIFRKSGLNRRAAQAEIGVLLKLRHPHIIGLREIFETKTEIQLVLELATGGELFERIVERGHYSEQDAASALRQILDALQYLHSKGVVHREIKPENLLYATEDDDSRIKLAYFGLNKMLESPGNPNITTHASGTFAYSAPEVLQNKKYDSAVDLWNLGVLAFIMLCGFEPFWDEAGELAVCKRVIEGSFEFSSPWWDDISDSAKDLITQLLQIDPSKRPTAVEAAKHPWVRGVTPLHFHMTQTIKKLREFNARRKFRAVTHAVLATKRALFLVSPAARKELQQGLDSNCDEAATSKST